MILMFHEMRRKERMLTNEEAGKQFLIKPNMEYFLQSVKTVILMVFP